MTYRFFFYCIFLLLYLSACQSQENGEMLEDPIYLAYPVMGNEMTATSVVLQGRLAGTDSLVNHPEDPKINWHRPGKKGWVRFEASTAKSFDELAYQSPWLAATAQSDFVVKYKMVDLSPGTTYFFRANYGIDTLAVQISEASEMVTLPGETQSQPASFVMVTGMHIHRFLQGGNGGGDKKQAAPPAAGENLAKGFPGLAAISQENPGFFIGNGDNVYYDHPHKLGAETVPQMRPHWHRLMQMPRFQQLVQHTPVLWLKDDHDFRYDDADLTGFPKKDTVNRPFPTVEDGLNIFREQVAAYDLEDEDKKTYRTFKVTRDLQIWLVEGRDFRSPNKMENNEGKTLWGEEQLTWLKNSLLASEATFKVLISPTPLIGPDERRKIDNHTNPDGFSSERDLFFDWLKENGFDKDNFYLICGDRHWQYHSVHPSGFEEFSCGALVDANARLGMKPGWEGSTDPNGEIEQRFTSPSPSGGYMLVEISGEPTLNIILKDEKGEELYRVEKSPK